MKYVVNQLVRNRKEIGKTWSRLKNEFLIQKGEERERKKRKKGNHILNVRVNSFHTSTTNTV